MYQPPFAFQYKETAIALYHALKPDPFYIALETSISTHIQTTQESMYTYMDYSMSEGKKYGRICLPAKSFQGASIWSKPLSYEESQQQKTDKELFLKKNLGPEAAKLYLTIAKFMSARSMEVIPEDSWYLSIIGIDPEDQGKGLGSSLILPILKETDEKGIGTYLETFTPRNISFYKRLGYRIVGEFLEPTIEAPYLIMYRSAPS